MIVSDNGTELISNAILSWQQEHDLEWHYIAPGKPMQNGFSWLQQAACMTSASTSTCSPTSARHARSSKNGGLTTIPTDRKRASTGSHQHRHRRKTVPLAQHQ
jgi:putative transposase